MTDERDYLVRGALADIDPDITDLIRHETARQARFLILIPSESTVPQAVREALMSPFHNLYAEGYPLDETRTMSQEQILDYGLRLPEYRRKADKRYYKGTEYANIVEALARRRAAELFATPSAPADSLYVNVQPLSGAPANSAIFSGLLNVGDTFMGMDLLVGGHLTHGSPVARSGKQYHAVGYTIDPVTERLDYDQIMAQAQEVRPKLIIAGYTSYPWAPDWAKFRAIADSVGAILMADVSHVAGMIAVGAYPSPIGIADVVSFTTHKTLNGPRGAVIVTHRADIAGKVDRAVFPGEQGGPHVNQIAALAVALKLATTEKFRALQYQTVANAARLADALSARGLRIAYGGTDTHMLLVDCKSIIGRDGTTLSGDMAARILDLAGIVLNRNTIPGDPSALRSSGIRIGTPWITQRGFGDAEIDTLAGLIADLLQACEPFSYAGKRRPEPRAKVDYTTLERVKMAVRDLAASVGIDTNAGRSDYPHVSYLDTNATEARTLIIRAADPETARQFLNVATTGDVTTLAEGQQTPALVLNKDGSRLSHGIIELLKGQWMLHLAVNAGNTADWLRALSDGFVSFDDSDPYGKLPGPVEVTVRTLNDPARFAGFDENAAVASKPYAVGMRAAYAANSSGSHPTLRLFTWHDPTDTPIKTTPLTDWHRAHGAKMAPFAGYDMPLWYDSVTAEHRAVRSGAGAFDVTHMGVFDVRGAGAAAFLDAVTTNDVATLAVGESHYTYLLDTEGVPLDDLMIYRLEHDHYLIVVNASNNDKNWKWLNGILAGDLVIDAAHPPAQFGLSAHVLLRDLRNPTHGADCRVDVALQGAQSKDILKALGGSDEDIARVTGLAWAGVTRALLGGFDLIVSRTGYTGERVAYELFVHPDLAVALFDRLIALGAVPCGLAARDSLRTEAGLPLYGHELAGDRHLAPGDAGFGTYVKLWKPFFVGKQGYADHEAAREREIVRFRLDEKGARPPHSGDPVTVTDGAVIGMVTSCSIDSEGYQSGQAWIDQTASDPETAIHVLCGAERAQAAGRTATAVPARVLTRFPAKKK
ncbi:MAG: serine hydroxymethyltransferase [Chloroflexota bacterium]|nr:serine hydroxymethyltransferase [Chloroflexota bacterium]